MDYRLYFNFVRGLRLFIALGITSLGTLALYFSPFYFAGRWPAILAVLHRLFPLHRGLFEDKVANFWCALAIFTKFHRRHTQEQLVRYCAGTLLATLLPSLGSLLLSKPSGNRFLYAAAYCSLCFFMFAYHVHEKNILVPLMAVLLLSHLSPIFVFWFSCIAVLSLYQLIEKDRLELQYLGAVTGWLLCSRRLFRNIRFGWPWKLLVFPTLLALYAVPLLQLTFVPPERYPHLIHVINILACAGAFGFSLFYLLYKQYTCESHYYYAHRSLVAS